MRPPRGEPGRKRYSVSGSVSARIVPSMSLFEATYRLEAAASLLSYALLGEIPLELAAEQAIRLIAVAQRHLDAA